jgi:hypothetical protein
VPWRSGIYNDTRPENVRSTIGWVCLFLLFGFAALDTFYPNSDVNLALDTIITVFGLHVVSKYVRKSLVAIFEGSRSSADFLIVGITLSWLGQAGRAVGSIITRLSGFDPAWVNSEFFGLIKLVTIVAAICHVVPAGAISRNGKESVPAPSRFGLAGTFCVAVALVCILLNNKPDLKPWIDRMPNWSRDMFSTGSVLKGRESHADAEPPS